MPAPDPVMFPSTKQYDDRGIEIVATALMEYAGTPDCQLPGTANERAIGLVEDLAVAHGPASTSSSITENSPNSPTAKTSSL
jgi:hypothetical protein